MVCKLPYSLCASEVLNFIVLDIDKMGHTQLNEFSARLILGDKFGEFLVQCDGALLSECLLSMILYNHETWLKNIRPVH